jgi:hypothetical protein
MLGGSLPCFSVREYERKGSRNGSCCKNAPLFWIHVLCKQGHPDNDTPSDDELREQVEIIHELLSIIYGIKYAGICPLHSSFYTTIALLSVLRKV